MLKCVFGQHGSVKDIEMNTFGLQSARVEYEDEHSTEVCLSNSQSKGICSAEYKSRILDTQ